MVKIFRRGMDGWLDKWIGEEGAGVNNFKLQLADTLEVRELKKQRKCSAVVTFSCKSQHLSACNNDGFQMARDGFHWPYRELHMCEFKCMHMWVRTREGCRESKYMLSEGMHPYACMSVYVLVCIRRYAFPLPDRFLS